MGGIGRRQFLSASIGTASCLAAPAKRWRIGCYTRPWMRSDYRAALDGIADGLEEHLDCEALLAAAR